MIDDIEQSVSYIELAIDSLTGDDMTTLQNHFSALAEIYDTQVLPLHGTKHAVAWSMALIWHWNKIDMPETTADAVTLVLNALGLGKKGEN